jgi:UDP-N-acetylglucosamine 4,6-dehydratase/5-epimerase
MSIDNFENKTLLVTGGTGSFGSTVVKHFLKTDISEIKVFSRDEKKQEDMRRRFSDKRLNFIIGDVRDLNSVRSATQRVNYVFQAAALKQVPSCEFFPYEAVKTNIMGSQNVLESAIEAGVERVVVLSTDKAVYPINAMGISKAMMERIAIAKAREQSLVKNGTKISVTRYGNVMCSRGSVIPFFIDKIRNGEPLTITDPAMTRFMMSLDESLKLVLFSFKDASQGDITVQKSPSSTVAELAKSLQRIFSSRSEIRIIGPRHGEKKHETLCSAEEMIKAIDCDGYYKVPADLRDHDYSEFGNEEINFDAQSYASNNTNILSGKALDDLLLQQSYVIDALKSHHD